MDLCAAAGAGFTSSGEQGLLRAMRDAQLKRYARGAESAYGVASIDARVGRQEEALRYLRLAIEKREIAILGLGHDLAFQRMRADPQFQDLLAKVDSMLH